MLELANPVPGPFRGMLFPQALIFVVVWDTNPFPSSSALGELMAEGIIGLCRQVKTIVDIVQGRKF